MEDQGITTLEPVPSTRSRPIFLGFVTFFSGILVGLIVSVYLPLSFLSKIIRPQVFVPPTDEVKKISCQYNDKTYQDGEMVPVDKCNTCTCLNGQVACTLMACE